MLVLATRGELGKLHFDDLFSPQQVRAAWDRLLGGTFAGLVWASERDDVTAAHHIVGVSLHALQDFYTHSNWLPPSTCLSGMAACLSIRSRPGTISLHSILTV